MGNIQFSTSHARPDQRGIQSPLWLRAGFTDTDGLANPWLFLKGRPSIRSFRSAQTLHMRSVIHHHRLVGWARPFHLLSLSLPHTANFFDFTEERKTSSTKPWSSLERTNPFSESQTHLHQHQYTSPEMAYRPDHYPYFVISTFPRSTRGITTHIRDSAPDLLSFFILLVHCIFKSAKSPEPTDETLTRQESLCCPRDLGPRSWHDSYDMSREEVHTWLTTGKLPVRALGSEHHGNGMQCSHESSWQ